MVVYYQVHTAAHSYLIVSTGDLKAINEFRYIPYHTDKTIELDDELIALEEDELHHT